MISVDKLIVLLERNTVRNPEFDNANLELVDMDNPEGKTYSRGLFLESPENFSGPKSHS